MANPDDVKYPDVRAALEEAGNLLDDGDYLGSVKSSVDAYMKLGVHLPDAIARPPAPGTPANVSRQWPSYLGVSIQWADDKPSMVFDKERFSMSEAASYFEYTVEEAVRAQG